jgi:hypothetical protein
MGRISVGYERGGKSSKVIDPSVGGGLVAHTVAMKRQKLHSPENPFGSTIYSRMADLSRLVAFYSLGEEWFIAERIPSSSSLLDRAMELGECHFHHRTV